jgi:hypothetical protein
MYAYSYIHMITFICITAYKYITFLYSVTTNCFSHTYRYWLNIFVYIHRYKMIFVPFTGVDHHDRSVLFGAGLLYDETIESYTWLLQMFLKAHKKQPLLILSDQDASMKQAISNVFTESTHRLCMWHITNKLPFKVYTTSNYVLFHAVKYLCACTPNCFITFNLMWLLTHYRLRTVFRWHTC